jgi:hypothetical protein
MFTKKSPKEPEKVQKDECCNTESPKKEFTEHEDLMAQIIFYKKLIAGLE